MTIFTGNVSKAASTRTVNVGGVPTLVTDFNVAENYRKADGSQGVQFYRISLWRERGAKLAQYLTTGRTVTISGRVKAAKPYQDKNGVWQSGLEMSNPQIQLHGANTPADAEPAEELPPVEEDAEEDKPF